MPNRPAPSPPHIDPHGFELEADLLRVMANPKRLMIVNVLGQGPSTVTDLAERLDLSLQNTSQHLRSMKDRGIVRGQRAGREVLYSLTSPVFSECCRLVRQTLVEEAHARPAHLGWEEGSASDTGAARPTKEGPVRHPMPVVG